MHDEAPKFQFFCSAPGCTALEQEIEIEEHDGKYGCPVCKRMGRELFWGEQYSTTAERN